MSIENSDLKSFAVRVYGVLIHENKVLLMQECHQGKEIMKFPGGGMELGEDVYECLKREFLEEINLAIEVKKHIYTIDFFQQSNFDPSEQIIGIYYRVKALNMEEIAIREKKIIEIHWMDLKDINEAHLSFPMDKRVVSFLKEI